jgi:uncharacterized protein (DUF1697 family)
MRQLKTVFEEVGVDDVRTYINSGNVIFASDTRAPAGLAEELEAAIGARFGVRVPVLLRNKKKLAAIVGAIPDDWRNDDRMRCDVLFLWDEVDSPSVLDELPFKPEFEDVRYESGAVIWRVDRAYVTRSGIPKLIGTPLYKKMTIRNCNTARKLLELMA